MCADLSCRENVAIMAADVRQRLGGLDILVNNAGVISGNFFLECGEQEIERSVAVNLLAHIWTVRTFLPEMVRCRFGPHRHYRLGRRHHRRLRLADYSASKFAAFGLDEALRNEFRRQRWNAAPPPSYTPYFIDTGMFSGVRTRFSWLLPILKEERVAHRILRAIARRRARLLMPPLVYAVWLLRLLPVRAFDWIADLLGIHRAMNRPREKRP